MEQKALEQPNPQEIRMERKPEFRGYRAVSGYLIQKNPLLYDIETRNVQMEVSA